MLTMLIKLVELMHGDITLDSVLGQGSVATFSIPFTKAPFYSDELTTLDMEQVPSRLRSEVSISDLMSVSVPPSPSSNLAMRRPSSHSRTLDSSPDLSEEERQRVHVLVVEDNPINQQIALKTIKKLNFSVCAVWNGQEALDYLLKEETPEHPKPDIILMDVQMPVMDGYKATYTIRHAEPFITDRRIQNTPIVAMTASAIQGDREKCESAGMNDYLSKPVKGKILESMLIKWALELKKKRKRSASKMGAEVPEVVKRRGSEMTNADRTTQKQGTLIRNDLSTRQQSQSSLDSPENARTKKSTNSQFSHRPLPNRVTTTPTKVEAPGAVKGMTDHFNKLQFARDHAIRRSSETPEGSAQRRFDYEEKAMQLRDNQLIMGSACNLSNEVPGHIDARNDIESKSNIEKSPFEETRNTKSLFLHPQNQPLTRENMARLQGTVGRLAKADSLGGNSSLDVDDGEDSQL